tara:strand:- start:1117 stop:1506 length:390 start_codon:yes stop_codon:yes gene_type:complete
MANIQLQRGLTQNVDVTYALSDSSKPDFTGGTGSPFDAELVIRRSLTGSVVDTLRHGTSSPARSDADSRIDFLDPASGPNVRLKWTTAQATKLPNEKITVIGDLKILNASSEVIHHIRLTFDVLPEVIE